MNSARAAKNFERLANTISQLGKTEIQLKIKNFKGRFKLDFSDDYLNSLSVDRLRHILFAAMSTKLKKAN